MDYVWIDGGGVTTPEGFVAGGVNVGIKTYGSEPRFDVGLLASTEPCSVAGVFTQNRVVGAPVELCRERIKDGQGRAIVANSGCSNVATGEQGKRDAVRMASVAAEHLAIAESEVLVASTGVIGRNLPMERIERGIRQTRLSAGGGIEFSRAIMTTDIAPKHRALSVVVDGVKYTVGGTAKGSGMVHPDMATVFCFMTTDAPVAPEWLKGALRAVADVSLNMIDVDMDTSTSDTMLLFANGLAGGSRIDRGHRAEAPLRRAFEMVAIALAKDLVREGEGARTVIEVRVRGARTVEDARKAARTVTSSPLVKTMVTGRDANLGRVMMAVGRSGADVDVSRTSVFIGEHAAFERGAPTSVPYELLSKALDQPEVVIAVDLGLGDASATAWGCDLTEEYIRINASYTT
ncbi:MAG TPA: bifunctional glutamate N-acetyltransferase/amino-acid acetyltransferase ArgJ [Polyangiaceae bacterium]|jgi:glutamate N-acetyltransferase/amino-acid N-acetyltransferase|nr:bifunctional glutamate N-acetyltransferase/amino-acid acetyltransferase ArgJ [Polyangiaceae bacterium]